MTEVKKYSKLMEEMIALRPQIEAAHERANREAVLTSARLGHSVCEGRDGKVIWITPAEIFARYGMDEFGRPLQSS